MTEKDMRAPPPNAGGAEPPRGFDRWRHIGPGIVAAATGVGAGDLVATLVAGARFGYTLLWAAVLGAIVKVALAEGAARFHLATGRTIFQGWRGLGRWASVYFGAYIIVWGLLYGATAMSATALPLAALFPAVPLAIWAVGAGLTGFIFVWFNRYLMFERVMKILVIVMFVVMVGLAAIVTPGLKDIGRGLSPAISSGSLFYTLALIGGVGGTITTAAYGYWVNAKGWHGPQWIGMMRLDNAIAYIMTGLFVIAMLIVGAELLYSARIALEDSDKGLVGLSDVLASRFGASIANIFLIGFAASALSSLLGVWHGVSLMFSDFVHQLRGHAERPDEAERSIPFRAYLIWLTFPPMLLLFLDRPLFLVILYGAFGAFFMPFLAITLLLLLNARQMPEAGRSGWLSNGVLGISAALFVALCGHQIFAFFA